MPGTGRAEIYFIAAMMLLIVILSITAVYIFIRTYKKEMAEKSLHNAKKLENAKAEPEVLP
jgi:flagellar basal body-associated protein FliL